MHCPRCGSLIPASANFCPQCGADLSRFSPVDPPTEPGPSAGRQTGWGTFALTLVASLALTVVLSLLLGFPVFILGAVLPLFWWGRRR